MSECVLLNLSINSLLLYNPVVLHRFHNSLPFDPVLNQLNSILTLKLLEVMCPSAKVMTRTPYARTVVAKKKSYAQVIMET
jgi:hypothetical protein